MRAVLVDDPDNERGHRVIDIESGRILASGYLEVATPELFTEPSPTPRSAIVRFVERVERDGG